MKITRIHARPLRAELSEPFRISLGLITHTTSVLVRVETDEGLAGVGEGAPAQFVTGETLEGVTAAVGRLAQALRGADPLDIEGIHRLMDANAARCPAAKAAVDIACYDLLSRRAGLPLHTLLGGPSGPCAVETDVTVSLDAPAAMAEKAARRVAEGFDALKLKVGLDPEEDLERVRLVREAAGPRTRLRLDANQGWTVKQALAMIERLARYDIELVEQPVAYHDLEGLAEVTRRSPVPIMSDESAFDARDVLRLLRLRAVDMVNIKIMKCGGIHEALKINALCEAAGVECMLGCMIEETNIGVAAAASVMAARRNITRADLDAVFSLREPPAPAAVEWAQGKTLRLGARPPAPVD